MRRRQNWADDFQDDGDSTALPPPETTVDPKTGLRKTVMYRINDEGKRQGLSTASKSEQLLTCCRVKTTRVVKLVVTKERVSKEEAARRNWSKFGAEKGKVR